MDARIARRRLRTQWLAPPHGATARDVVGHLLAVQAENPAQSAWAVAARTTAPDAGDLAAALATGQVLRTHVLRSTWHYVARTDADWLLALTGPRAREPAEQALLGEVGLTRVELDELGGTAVDALAATPDLTRDQVGDALRERVPGAAGRLTGYALMLLMAHLELDRRVCSGRPVDATHTYAAWDDRVGGRVELSDADRDDLLGRLALRYLAGHGPATVKDLAYWATLSLGDARRAVRAAGDGLASFEHDGRVYWHLSGDAPGDAGDDADAHPGPAGHLLQVLDELYRGYQDSRWALDAEHVVPRSRERAIGMAVVGGQIVASMKRTVGAARVRFDLAPYRPLSTAERDALEEAAARYGRFLGLDPEVRTAGE